MPRDGVDPCLTAEGVAAMREAITTSIVTSLADTGAVSPAAEEQAAEWNAAFDALQADGD